MHKCCKIFSLEITSKRVVVEARECMRFLALRWAHKVRRTEVSEPPAL